MPLSTFSDLRKLTNNSGAFPDALVPASQVQFRYQYQIDLTSQLEFSTGNLVVVNIKATFDVLDAGGSLLLEFTIAATYLAGQDVFGFTYYPSQQSVTFTPAVPIIGDPGGTIIQGDSGSGSASGADIIFDQFLSPVFVLPIPAGATVKITFHTAQYPALDDIEGLQVSTRPGGGGVSGYRHGVDGQVRLVSSGSGVSLFTAIDRARTLLPPAPLTWKPDTKIILLQEPGTTAARAFYGQGGNTVSQTTYDEGLNFTMATIFTGYTPLDIISRDGGQTFLLASSTGAAFIGYVDRSGAASVPIPITVPAGTKLAEGKLLGEDGGGLDFYWPASSGLSHLHSDDELTWS